MHSCRCNAPAAASLAASPRDRPGPPPARPPLQVSSLWPSWCCTASKPATSPACSSPPRASAATTTRVRPATGLCAPSAPRPAPAFPTRAPPPAPLPATPAALTSQYFGPYEQYPLTGASPFTSTPPGAAFNRPQGCVNVTVDLSVQGQTFARPVGAQRCAPSGDNTAWSIFPWVKDTNAAGEFPGCAAAGGDTVLTEQTSPAYQGTAAAAPEVEATACQNFVPTSS